MGRPKAEKPKEALVSLRTFPEVEAAIADYARRERRTISQMAELLVREAILARRKKQKEPADDIKGLP